MKRVYFLIFVLNFMFLSFNALSAENTNDRKLVGQSVFSGKCFFQEYDTSYCVISGYSTDDNDSTIQELGLAIVSEEQKYDAKAKKHYTHRVLNLVDIVSALRVETNFYREDYREMRLICNLYFVENLTNIWVVDSYEDWEQTGNVRRYPKKLSEKERGTGVRISEELFDVLVLLMESDVQFKHKICLIDDVPKSLVGLIDEDDDGNPIYRHDSTDNIKIFFTCDKKNKQRNYITETIFTSEQIKELTTEDRLYFEVPEGKESKIRNFYKKFTNLCH